jgi:hypothetical protein
LKPLALHHTLKSIGLKSIAYWQSIISDKPKWFDKNQWRWVQNKELSKLIGTIFGLHLDVLDVDEFLMSKILKITY